jgi:hypothetical protein
MDSILAQPCPQTVQQYFSRARLYRVFGAGQGAGIGRQRHHHA